MFQNEALANKLKKRYKKQKKLREYLEVITKIPLQKEQMISYLEVKSKKILLHIEGGDRAKVEQYFTSKKMKVTIKVKKEKLKVEIAL